MDLFVGQTSLKGDFRRYAREFNYVELLAEPQVLPNIKKVKALAGETRGSIQFGVVLSPRVWEGSHDELHAYFKKVVAACAPVWIIARTPATVRPGPASERELAKKFADLRPLAGNARLAWEPRGLWQPATIARFAQDLEVTPVWDGQSLPASGLGEGTAYVRFAELGVGARVNEGRLERLAVKAEHCEALYVVVEGRGAQRTRQILQGIFADPFAGLGDDEVGETDVETRDIDAGEDLGGLESPDTDESRDGDE